MGLPVARINPDYLKAGVTRGWLKCLICKRCGAYLNREQMCRTVHAGEQDVLYGECYQCGELLWWRAL